MVSHSRIMVYTDHAMLAHDPGDGHPERPARLAAILNELQARPIDRVSINPPHAAERPAIERIHDPRYIDRIDSLHNKSAPLDPDTVISPGSVKAAYLAAGAAIDAVDSVVGPESDRRGQPGKTRAFALVRPPGHHAERDHAMGFCLLNNISIAAAHAISALGCERVLIVDWDVHHGNGTQHAFESRRDVLVFNTHQRRLFPDTGELDEVGTGEGRGYTVNCPLPPGMNDATYLAIFERILTPIADQYQPDLVLVSAGFDAHRDDPLGGMLVTETGFAHLCAMVRDIADRHADGRLALVLEGGYNLDALARSVHACVAVLAGALPPLEESGPIHESILTILRDHHRRFWRI